MAEDVGHVDGDLDLVVECLGPGVGVAESDGPEDVVLASVGLPAWFDDLGDAAVGGPEDPSFQPGPGLVDGPSPFAAPVVVLRALASAARTPGCRLPAPPPTKTTQEPDLNCSLHGGIIPVPVPPEVPLREFPYNAVVELVNPGADTVSRKTYTGADADWYVKAEDIVLKNAGNPRNHTPQGQPKK